MNDNINHHLWAADELQEIVMRNAKVLRHKFVSMVKALMADGRPIFTEKVPEMERIQALLDAPPQFWDAIAESDPETAIALMASVLKAREEGKIPALGPRANEVTEEDFNKPLPFEEPV